MRTLHPNRQQRLVDYWHRALAQERSATTGKKSPTVTNTNNQKPEINLCFVVTGRQRQHLVPLLRGPKITEQDIAEAVRVAGVVMQSAAQLAQEVA